MAGKCDTARVIAPAGIPPYSHYSKLYTARRGGVRHGTRVRSAPDDDADRHRRQRERLQQLSDYCRRNARRLMFELLVPPTRAQIDSVRGDQPVYDRQLRPTLMLAAVRSLADYLTHKITRTEAASRTARRYGDCAARVQRARREPTM